MDLLCFKPVSSLLVVILHYLLVLPTETKSEDAKLKPEKRGIHRRPADPRRGQSRCAWQVESNSRRRAEVDEILQRSMDAGGQS